MKNVKNIVRIEKRDKGFTVISRMLLEDPRLGWATRGIIAYLLSKPDNWILQVEDLRKRGDLGRDAIYKRIKNAIECGYITRIDHRNKNGRISHVEYIVREEPIYPLPENKDTGDSIAKNQDTGNPDPENKDITKYEVLPNTKKTTTTTILNDVGCSGFKFHKKITKNQKIEICKLLQTIAPDIGQDILFELSGFIDKNLVKKDEVSLVQGFVRKAKQGEFFLRTGIKYKESAMNAKKIQEINRQAKEYKPDLKPANINNPLVQKLQNIRKREEHA